MSGRESLRKRVWRELFHVPDPRQVAVYVHSGDGHTVLVLTHRFARVRADLPPVVAREVARRLIADADAQEASK